MSLYSLALEATILLGVWLGLAMIQMDPNTPGRRTFILLTSTWMAWCVGALGQERGLLSASASFDLMQLGTLMIPPLWLGLAAQAARLEIGRRVPWLPAPLATPGLIVYLLLLSDRWRGLYASGAGPAGESHGPLWAVMIAYGYALSLIGCVILVVAALRWRQDDEPSRRFAVAVAPFITLAGSGLHFSGVWQLGADPTPILLGGTLFALHRGIFAGGLLQALSVSQHALVQQLPLGIVLTDRRGVVVDVNPVAERRLGLSARQAVGRNFDAVANAADTELRYEITPVMSAGSEVGHIVQLDPPGKEEVRRGAFPGPAAP